MLATSEKFDNRLFNLVQTLETIIFLTRFECETVMTKCKTKRNTCILEF